MNAGDRPARRFPEALRAVTALRATPAATLTQRLSVDLGAGPTPSAACGAVSTAFKSCTDPSLVRWACPSAAARA